MAIWNLRDIVAAASSEIGITAQAISAAIGSLDPDINQMVALMSVVADEVVSEEPYRITLGDGIWVMDGSGTTQKPVPSADTDLILFDHRLAINGLKYRFLKAKGLEFGEEMR